MSVTAAAVSPQEERKILPHGWGDLFLQIAIWFGFLAAYQVARGVADRNAATAFENGLKLDMALIRGIDESAARRAIVAGVLGIADAIGVRCIAEGIETAAELRTLKEIGMRLCQGYLLARPATEVLPVIDRERLRT